MVLQHYYGEDFLKHRVASTLLSLLLLYVGLCLSLYFSVRGILMNITDVIRLILRDEAVRGYYSGYKYQQGSDLHPERVAEMEDFIFQLLDDLYELELKYPDEVYGSADLMDDVAVFVRYSADKTIMDLGYPTRFAPEETEVKVNILAALTPGSEETHDFFLGSGSSHTIGSAGSTNSESWGF